jgi:tetratricopeptide (TPR) repeat protein
MYNKVLNSFKETRDQIGLGNVYQCTGNIYIENESYNEAQEMYGKALDCFKKANEPIGQGNVFISMGDIYFYNHDPIHEENMYDQALNFFEKSKEPFCQAKVLYQKGGIYLHTVIIQEHLICTKWHWSFVKNQETLNRKPMFYMPKQRS